MHDSDTGSTPVQIARLTKRINHLNTHLQRHHKDKHTKQGLLKLVSSRRKHLKYLRRSDPGAYFSVISSLGIKDKVFRP